MMIVMVNIIIKKIDDDDNDDDDYDYDDDYDDDDYDDYDNDDDDDDDYDDESTFFFLNMYPRTLAAVGSVLIINGYHTR